MKLSFTLIEFIIVILILAIVAMVSMNVRTNLTTLRIHQAAQKIQSDIRYAQSYALAFQKRTAILFSTANDNYSIYVEPTYGTNDWSVNSKAKNPLTQQDFDVQLNSGEFQGVDITYVLFNTVNYALMFDRDGTPYGMQPTSPFKATLLSDPAGIILNTGQKYILVKQGTGKVNVQNTYP